MTPSARNGDLPGTMLLKIARSIYEEPIVESVVQPAIADLHQDIRAAGDNRVRALAARWRGYWSIAIVLLVLPISLALTPALRRDGNALRGTGSGVMVVLLIAVLFVSTWGMFLGMFVAGTLTGGVLLAMALHWWYGRHPMTTVDATPLALTRPPEINLSSIRVAGNLGGLMFVVGSIVIVLIGLPGAVWFLLAAVLAGMLMAALLFRWRTTHPSSGLPENSIVAR